MSIHRLFRALAALTLCLTLCACGGASNRVDRTIHVAYTTAWGDFDPYYSTSGTMYELALYDKVFDKLVFTDMAGAEILPRAATSWESVDDGLSILFHLNKDSVWSDGLPVTARDWAFTVNLLADPASAFSTRVFTEHLTGTDENGVRLDGEPFGAEAVDDYAFKLTFKSVTAPEDFLLHYNRQFVVLPEHALKDVPPAELLTADFWRKPVGSGPCIFVSQVVGSEMLLAPNARYQLGVGDWDAIALHVMDFSNKLTALMSGATDFIELGSDITADDKPLMESHGLTVHDASVRNFFMEVLINENTIPDARIRQALHYAVDKASIMQAASRDVSRAAYSYEMLNTDYYDASLEFPRDVEKAKALLAEAGYAGETYAIAFASKRENIAALLVQQWAEAGISVQMNIVDVATMFSGLAKGDYDLGLSGHSATAYSLWFENEFPANDNPAPDPVRDDYVARIQSTVDHDAKAELVKEYQRYLAEQTYFIPLYFAGNYWVESPRVEGIRDSASLMCNDNVWEWRIR